MLGPSPLQLGRKVGYTNTACEELERGLAPSLGALTTFFFSLFQVVAHTDALHGTHNSSRGSVDEVD